MRRLTISLAAIFLASCSGQGETDHSAQNEAHKIAGGLVISSARVLPPFPGRDTAAGYFEITNHGDRADRLISASSPISAAVEIHNHIEENGVMKMRRVEGVEIGPGETVVFKPGSYHLMMFKSNLPKDQENVSLTLNYEHADPVTLIVDVMSHDEEIKGNGSSDEGHGSAHKGRGSGYGSGDKAHGSGHEGKKKPPKNKR